MRLIDADELMNELMKVRWALQMLDDTWAADKAMGGLRAAEQKVKDAPTIEPTLYGYQIEHLALIARVMEKEGVTPEKAVQAFGDMKRIIEMLIDEIQETVERTMMEVEHE